ncbi:hypothetical protein ACQ4PT_016235 [Festuca glaucescens]
MVVATKGPRHLRLEEAADAVAGDGQAQIPIIDYRGLLLDHGEESAGSKGLPGAQDWGFFQDRTNMYVYNDEAIKRRPRTHTSQGAHYQAAHDNLSSFRPDSDCETKAESSGQPSLSTKLQCQSIDMVAGDGKLALQQQLQSKNVCVVGGGMAGLAAARELRREGHAVTVMEQSGDVGGQWLYDPRTDGDDPLGAAVPVRVPGSIYACLRLISPREAMGFSDFQFVPRDGDDRDQRRFPGHREVHCYLRDFCDAFGLMDAVRLNTRVLRVAAAAPTPTLTTRQWAVRSVSLGGGTGTDDAQDEVFDAVVVATGHYSQPMLPRIQGVEDWRRRQLHSHSYRTPEPFQGETVVVVGCGDSGKDIALDLCQVAREVHLTANSSSADEATTPAMSRMLANHGDKLRLHPRIRRLHADGRVEFADGSSVLADTVIYCTGYGYSFPFLDTGGAVAVEDEVVGPLFEHVFPPSLAPSLSFVGVPRKILVPWFFETQARWIAQVLSGRCALPPEEEMLRSVEEHYRAREAAGVPRKLTHNIGGVEPLVRNMHIHIHSNSLIDMDASISNLCARAFYDQKMYEFGEKYCDFAPLEEWKKELVLSSILSMKDDAESFRDHADDSENVQKGLRAWRGLAARAQDKTMADVEVEADAPGVPDV